MTWYNILSWFHSKKYYSSIIVHWGFRVTVFNATFNNISAITWWSVLLVEETGVPRKNHRPVESHWQTWSHNVVSSNISPWMGLKLTTLVVIGIDGTGRFKSNHHNNHDGSQCYKGFTKWWHKILARCSLYLAVVALMAFFVII